MHSFFTRLYPVFFSSNMYKKSWPLLYIKTSFYIEPSVDTGFCNWADHTMQACFYKDELVVCLWTLASLDYSLAVYLCLCVISTGTTDQANYFSSALVMEAAVWYFRPTCFLLSDHNAATHCIRHLCHHAHIPAVEWLNASSGSFFVTKGFLEPVWTFLYTFVLNAYLSLHCNLRVYFIF